MWIESFTPESYASESPVPESVASESSAAVSFASENRSSEDSSSESPLAANRRPDNDIGAVNVKTSVFKTDTENFGRGLRRKK